MTFLRRDYSEQRAKIRETEDPRRTEFLIRVFGLAIPVLLGYWLTELSFLLPWYICMLTTVAIAQIIHWLTLNSSSFGAFAASLFGAGLQAVVVAYLPYWLWQSPDPLYNFFGTMLLIAGVIHTFVQRHAIFALLVVVTMPFLVVIALVGLQLAEGRPELGAIVIICVVLLVIYTFVAIHRREIDQRQYDSALTEAMHSQRASAMTRFVGGIAHDFNNLLTVILGSLDLYPHLPSTQEKRSVLQDAQDAAKRGAELVANLLRYSRDTPAEFARFDLRDLASDVVRTAKRLVPSYVHLQVEVTTGPVTVDLDKTQFEAAVLNLITNSAQAIERQGAIYIVVELVSPEIACLRVSDTGSGIPSEVLARVTEPFFTTKPPGEGTGLGLASVQDFVKTIGGQMAIDSTEHIGTVVELKLPLARASQASNDQG